MTIVAKCVKAGCTVSDVELPDDPSDAEIIRALGGNGHERLETQCAMKRRLIGDLYVAYGVVTVQPSKANTLYATVVRLGDNDSYRFPTPVRQ